jgi:hypothetical protein
MILLEYPDNKSARQHLTLGKDYAVVRELGNGLVIEADNSTPESPNFHTLLASRFKEVGVVVNRDCTKAKPMPLELGPRAVELNIIWDHDDIEDLAPDLDSRYAHFKCGSCGHDWWADLGD